MSTRRTLQPRQRRSCLVQIRQYREPVKVSFTTLTSIPLTHVQRHRVPPYNSRSPMHPYRTSARIPAPRCRRTMTHLVAVRRRWQPKTVDTRWTCCLIISVRTRQTPRRPPHCVASPSLLRTRPLTAHWLRHRSISATIVIHQRPISALQTAPIVPRRQPPAYSFTNGKYFAVYQ